MRKYFIPLGAIFIAFVCFSFFPKKAEGPDCLSSSYYWFCVKPTVNKTSCTSLIRSDFLEVLDPNQNGAVDPGELAILLSNGELEQGNPSINPCFGCPDQNLYVCALSYDLTSTSAIAVIRNASHHWIFVPAAPSSIKCCVKRPAAIPKR